MPSARSASLKASAPRSAEMYSSHSGAPSARNATSPLASDRSQVGPPATALEGDQLERRVALVVRRGPTLRRGALGGCQHPQFCGALPNRHQRLAVQGREVVRSESADGNPQQLAVDLPGHSGQCLGEAPSRRRGVASRRVHGGQADHGTSPDRPELCLPQLGVERHEALLVRRFLPGVGPDPLEGTGVASPFGDLRVGVVGAQSHVVPIRRGERPGRGRRRAPSRRRRPARSIGPPDRAKRRGTRRSPRGGVPGRPGRCGRGCGGAAPSCRRPPPMRSRRPAPADRGAWGSSGVSRTPAAAATTTPGRRLRSCSTALAKTAIGAAATSGWSKTVAGDDHQVQLQLRRLGHGSLEGAKHVLGSPTGPVAQMQVRQVGDLHDAPRRPAPTSARIAR